MSKPGNTGIPSTNQQVRILYTAQPSTILYIHQMLDAIKGKDAQGKAFTKLRRYIRKPGKTDKDINTFSFTDPQGNKIYFGFDRSVIIFNAENAAKRQLFILKEKLGAGGFGTVKNVGRGVDVISAQTGKESILKIIPFAVEPMPIAQASKAAAAATASVAASATAVAPPNQAILQKKILPSRAAVVQEAMLEKELGDSEGYVERFTHGSNKIYILQPKYPGIELYKCYQQNLIQHFDEKLEISIKLLEQLKSRFHDKGYLHRDLKPDNIIYDQKTKSLRIIDMGFVIKSLNIITGVANGTLGYIAPEILSKSHYSEKSDVFAVGKILTSCLQLSARVTNEINMNGDLGKMLYVDKSAYFESIFKSLVAKENGELGLELADKLAKFMFLMCDPDVNKRLTVQQSLKGLYEIQKIRSELLEKQRKEKMRAAAAKNNKDKSESPKPITKSQVKANPQAKAQAKNQKKQNIDNEMSRKETLPLPIFEEHSFDSRSTSPGSDKDMSDKDMSDKAMFDKENTTPPPPKRRSPFE